MSNDELEFTQFKCNYKRKGRQNAIRPFKFNDQILRQASTSLQTPTAHGFNYITIYEDE